MCVVLWVLAVLHASIAGGSRDRQDPEQSQSCARKHPRPSDTWTVIAIVLLQAGFSHGLSGRLRLRIRIHSAERSQSPPRLQPWPRLRARSGWRAQRRSIFTRMSLSFGHAAQISLGRTSRSSEQKLANGRDREQLLTTDCGGLPPPGTRRTSWGATCGPTSARSTALKTRLEEDIINEKMGCQVQSKDGTCPCWRASPSLSECRAVKCATGYVNAFKLVPVRSKPST